MEPSRGSGEAVFRIEGLNGDIKQCYIDGTFEIIKGKQEDILERPIDRLIIKEKVTKDIKLYMKNYRSNIVNKNKIREYNKTYQARPVTCECGTNTTYGALYSHRKGEIHNLRIAVKNSKKRTEKI